jgi:hypothetical protein
MLGSAPCLGAFLDQAVDIPGRVLDTVPRQLDLPAAVILDGHFASPHRELHLQLIRERHGFHELLGEYQLQGTISQEHTRVIRLSVM